MQVTVPQAHEPSAEAEVDVGEFHAQVAEVLLKLWIFVMRLSCSGRAFHVAFATQAQEAFLEGYVLAFEYFGAVPGRVRYDNLKPAVVRVLRGRDHPPDTPITELVRLAKVRWRVEHDYRELKTGLGLVSSAPTLCCHPVTLDRLADIDVSQWYLALSC